MKLITRNPLAYPAGFAPGFDPSHLASPGCQWSVVSTGTSAINIVRPKPPSAQVSAPARINDSIIGLASKFTGTTGNGLAFTGGANAAADLVLTYACIFRPSSLSTNTSIVGNSTTVSSGSLLSFSKDFGNSFVVGFLNGSPVFANITPVVNVPYFIIVSASGVSNGSWSSNWLVLRLDTGKLVTATSTQPDVGTIIASDGNMVFGGANNPQGNNDATGNLSAAMYSSSFVMSLTQMRQWAADPWLFWYPIIGDSEQDEEWVGAAAASFVPYNPWPLLGPLVAQRVWGWLPPLRRPLWTPSRAIL